MSRVDQADNNGTSIIGAATNQTGEEIAVQTYCFNGNSLASEIGDFAAQDGNIASGGQATFSTALYDEKCPTFATAVSGYFT